MGIYKAPPKLLKNTFIPNPIDSNFSGTMNLVSVIEDRLNEQETPSINNIIFNLYSPRLASVPYRKV